MSTQVICNKCGNKIKTNINVSSNSQYNELPYCKLYLHKYSYRGMLIDKKEYHLCESCGKLFDEFINIDMELSKLKNTSDKELNYIITKNSNMNSDNLHSTIAYGGKSNCDQHTAYTLGDHVMPIENTIQIGNMLKPLKSDMVIGNVHIYNTKKFNKLEKFMWKKFFGIEIKEIDNNEKNN